MAKPVILVGAGGHAQVVAEALLLSGHRILGVVDPHIPMSENWHFGLRVLGDDDYLNQCNAREIVLANGLGMLPGTTARRQIFESWSGNGFTFACVIHPSAIVADEVRIDSGAQLLAGCIVNVGTHVGANTIINSGAIVEHHVKVGAHCHLAPAAVVCGESHIGDGSFVGAGAVVIHSQRLESGTVVSAGSCIRTQPREES